MSAASVAGFVSCLCDLRRCCRPFPAPVQSWSNALPAYSMPRTGAGFWGIEIVSLQPARRCTRRTPTSSSRPLRIRSSHHAPRSLIGPIKFRTTVETPVRSTATPADEISFLSAMATPTFRGANFLRSQSSGTKIRSALESLADALVQKREFIDATSCGRFLFCFRTLRRRLEPGRLVWADAPRLSLTLTTTSSS